MLYTTSEGIQKEIEELQIDLVKGLKSRSSDIKYKRGDRNSRQLVVQLVDGSTPFDLSKYHVRLYALKPDGTKVWDDCEINDVTHGVLSITLKEQFLSCVGTVNCEFLLTAADDSFMATPTFKIKVEESINDENAIESTNEFRALLNAIDTVDNLDNKMEILESKLNTTNSKMDFLENSITNINVDELIKEHGVTEGLQLALDTLCEAGKGQLLLNGIYEIERPLVLNRENKDLSTSIKIFGNATIRKANSFDGISLLRLERGFHDEDCIVFENINFDGVNRTINGIDTYKPHIPVDEYGTVMDDSHGSKYVCFNNCTFVNCYTGARLTSLSYNFNGCLFHSNNYGVKLGARANANTFTGCSIRTNIVGVELRQLDATIGTCSNSFYTCTIESNRNVGIASFNDQDTKIIGCYIENNGYAIDSRFPSFGNYRCHIYFGSFGGAGGHYIDGFFSTSDNDYALGGAYFLGVVQSKVKCLFDVIGDGTYLNTPLANVKISGNSTYKSSFKLGDGKQYVCLGNTTNIISMTDNYNTDSVTVDVTSSLTKNVTNISNLTKFKLCTIKLNQLYIGKLEFTAGITGKTAGGAPSSQGIIIQDLAVSNKYATHYIKGAGNPLLVTGVDGKRDTEKSNSIFGSSSGITIERVDSGTFDLYVTNLVNNALAGWGIYTRIELDIICHLRGTARGIANHMILS